MKFPNGINSDMIQQTTFLLRSIWEDSSWHDTVLATFENWVQDKASRSDTKGKLKALIKTQLTERAGLSTLDIDLEQINWDQLTEFLCTCSYRKRLRLQLPDVPPDDIWVRLADAQTWGDLSLHPQQEKAINETVPVPFFPLEQKLLIHGGRRMVYRYEPDLKPLLHYGEVFDEPVEMVPGKAHQCHSNVAQYWNENREACAIVTGYALSEDELWRQHSWLIRRKPTAGQCRVIETTIRRRKYFGFILNDVEAEIFYKRNI